jgi:hypothetical protein
VQTQKPQHARVARSRGVQTPAAERAAEGVEFSGDLLDVASAPSHRCHRNLELSVGLGLWQEASQTGAPEAEQPPAVG